MYRERDAQQEATLAALLVLGVTVLLTGSAISSMVLSFVRRPTPSSQSMGTRA